MQITNQSGLKQHTRGGTGTNFPLRSPFAPQDQSASLILDFQNQVYGVQTAGGKSPTPKRFTDLVTFSRASTATYFDRTGTLVQSAVDTPRFGFDPLTFQAKGLLIEEQRTNLAINSEAMGPSAGTNVSSDVNMAPSGAITAELVAEDATSGEHYSKDITVAVAVGDSYTWSAFIKDSPSANRSLFLRFATATTAAVYFDPRAKSLTNLSGQDSSGFVELPGGWFRVWMTATMSTTGNLVARLQLRDAGGGYTYTGDGASGLYLWGAQLEKGSFPTSYIPTNATAVTRAADMASITPLAPWFNGAAGTLYGNYSQNAGIQGPAFQGPVGAFNPVAAGSFLSLNGTMGANTGWFAGSPPGQSNISIGPSHKQAFAYAGANFAACADAGTVFTSASSDYAGTSTSLTIGQQSGNSFLNGWIASLKYYPTQYNSGALQALTT